ncbi:unnamed protein product [Notodromas monacha]|uniref:K Homology domain-containing protein n=1 Tax=Notodromas monacha TaxID=399045 RepID=A0A7R9BPA1_9CRUS|nr:unnamed protein product [Notodromas monacha]CAG0919184.1 unnamed protein product [Notodromas monacha]
MPCIVPQEPELRNWSNYRQVSSSHCSIVQVNLDVNWRHHGAMIGKHGWRIGAVSQQTATVVRFPHKSPDCGSGEGNSIGIAGPLGAVEHAFNLVQGLVPVEVEIRGRDALKLLENPREDIRALKIMCGVHIRVDKDKEVAHIRSASGPDPVSLAVKALQRFLPEEQMEVVFRLQASVVYRDTLEDVLQQMDSRSLCTVMIGAEVENEGEFHVDIAGGVDEVMSFASLLEGSLPVYMTVTVPRIFHLDEDSLKQFGPSLYVHKPPKDTARGRQYILSTPKNQAAFLFAAARIILGQIEAAGIMSAPAFATPSLHPVNASSMMCPAVNNRGPHPGTAMQVSSANNDDQQRVVPLPFVPLHRRDASRATTAGLLFAGNKDARTDPAGVSGGGSVARVKRNSGEVNGTTMRRARVGNFTDRGAIVTPSSRKPCAAQQHQDRKNVYGRGQQQQQCDGRHRSSSPSAAVRRVSSTTGTGGTTITAAVSSQHRGGRYGHYGDVMWNRGLSYRKPNNDSSSTGRVLATNNGNSNSRRVFGRQQQKVGGNSRASQRFGKNVDPAGPEDIVKKRSSSGSAGSTNSSENNEALTKSFNRPKLFNKSGVKGKKLGDGPSSAGILLNKFCAGGGGDAPAACPQQPAAPVRKPTPHVPKRAVADRDENKKLQEKAFLELQDLMATFAAAVSIDKDNKENDTGGVRGDTYNDKRASGGLGGGGRDDGGGDGELLQLMESAELRQALLPRRVMVQMPTDGRGDGAHVIALGEGIDVSTDMRPGSNAIVD